MAIRRGKSAETERDEAIHRHLQALIELAMNTVYSEYFRDLASGEGDCLGEVVLEGENSQGNENIEILLGGQPKIRVPLNLPRNVQFHPIRQHFRALNLDLTDAFSDPSFQDSKGDCSQIFFFDGEV